MVAAPLDALQVRLRASDMLERQYRSMWQYGSHKLKEIGIRGIFAGWTLSFLRDSLGYGLFFSSFEYIKSQAYYSYIAWYYGSLPTSRRFLKDETHIYGARPTIQPHFALEPCFLMVAGLVASIMQQLVQYPLGRIQNLHYERLEYLDHQAGLGHSRPQMMRLYYHAYQETLKRCKKRATRVGGWRSWLYHNFFRNSIRQVPSTSAGLVIFELVRRKYAASADFVCIEKNGYDILLS